MAENPIAEAIIEMLGSSNVADGGDANIVDAVAMLAQSTRAPNA